MMEFRIAVFILFVVYCMADIITGIRRVNELEHENAVLKGIVRSYKKGGKG